jgi:hypothetical protein
MTLRALPAQPREIGIPVHWGLMAVGLLVVGLVLVGCGASTETSPTAVTQNTASPTDGLEGESLQSPLSQHSPLATATPFLAVSLAPAQTPVPTHQPMALPGQLVVLHTNDNWGETEPCG